MSVLLTESACDDYHFGSASTRKCLIASTDLTAPGRAPEHVARCRVVSPRRGRPATRRLRSGTLGGFRTDPQEEQGVSITIAARQRHTDNDALAAALADAEARYTRANPNSLQRQREAAAAMPGGNTRTVLHYTPFPVAFARAEGATLYDLDGHRYLDFLGEFSAGLYGHSHPAIMTA